MSCYNREREVRHNKNAKGGNPTKWTALLSDMLVEIRRGDERQVLDIGLRSGRAEAERFVARRWPDWELVDVIADDPPELAEHFRWGVLPAARIETPTTPYERTNRRMPVRIPGY